jgi:hypothetical protein
VSTPSISPPPDTEDLRGLARGLRLLVEIGARTLTEDVDLVATDRDFAPDGNPLLFSLLDAMDGVGTDADVTFALTTNRADILCLSGQCGFSSTVEGNALTRDEQLAKLRLIVEVARDIWGD